MILCSAVREFALSLPGVEEREHFGRPSFRVRKKIIATLWEDEKRAVLKLTLDEQDALVEAYPDAFFTGPWSRQGWTNVQLSKVDPELFRQLFVDIWRRLAPRRVVAAYDAGIQQGNARP